MWGKISNKAETVRQKHFKMKFLLHINLTANRYFPATIFGSEEPLRAYRESFYLKLHELTMVNLRFFDNISVTIYCNLWRNKERCFSSCHERGTKKKFFIELQISEGVKENCVWSPITSFRNCSEFFYMNFRK